MDAFFNGLAEILEIDAADITPELKLGDYAWDSLAIISVIALVDELYDQMLNGQALSQCVTVADILAMINTGAAH